MHACAIQKVHKKLPAIASYVLKTIHIYIDNVRRGPFIGERVLVG